MITPRLFLLFSLTCLSFTLNAEIKLKLGHVATETHSIGIAATRFATALHEISAGEVEVDISPRSELGTVGDMWVQMQTGSLDIQTIDIGAITILKEAKPLMVMWTPFLFRDQQHYRNYILSSEFSEPMDAVRERTGIRFVKQIADRSPRIIATTNRAISTITDMRNLKVRVPPNPLFIDTFKYWQSLPTPIKASEILMSLRSGVVDAQDNGIIDIGNTGKSALKHVTPINWARSGVGLFFSEQKWNELSTQQHEWIIQAASVANISSEQEFKRLMAESWKRLEHMEIQVTKPDLTGFLHATDIIVEKYEGDWWPTGLVNRIRKID